MIPDKRGVFVTLDGLGGAGKSTTSHRLCELLTRRGHRVHATTQPSRAQLGEIARNGTDTYAGHALACLVAADRYHHLDTVIRPRLAEGFVVVCDRYVPSSYVLQRMDGVPIEFVEALNAAADLPDLSVILVADPAVSAARVERRGAHSRFHSGPDASRAEAELYSDSIPRLSKRGYPLFTVDTTHTTSTEVAELLARRITTLAGR
jgi:dTMP kinase